MASTIPDRYIWLGFGVFFLAAACGIRYAITDIVQLTKLDIIDPAPGSIGVDDDPEKSISLDTLKTLATSPNSDIANSAISLIIERFAQEPNASEILAREIHSKDETIRHQARAAVIFLQENPPVGPLELPYPRRTRLDWQDDAFESGHGHQGSDLTAPRLPMMERLELGDMVPVERDARGGTVPMDSIAGWNAVHGGDDHAEWDESEQESRRRRREAMVLHEGSRRVDGDDDRFGLQAARR